MHRTYIRSVNGCDEVGRGDEVWVGGGGVEGGGRDIMGAFSFFQPDHLFCRGLKRYLLNTALELRIGQIRNNDPCSFR